MAPVLPSEVQFTEQDGGRNPFEVALQGQRRHQALCRRVFGGPTGNWASIILDFTMSCRSCRAAISAPSLRSLLSHHAVVPFTFRCQVRWVTYRTSSGFYASFAGDIALAVVAHEGTKGK